MIENLFVLALATGVIALGISTDLLKWRQLLFFIIVLASFICISALVGSKPVINPSWPTKYQQYVLMTTNRVTALCLSLLAAAFYAILAVICSCIYGKIRDKFREKDLFTGKIWHAGTFVLWGGLTFCLHTFYLTAGINMPLYTVLWLFSIPMILVVIILLPFFLATCAMSKMLKRL